MVASFESVSTWSRSAPEDVSPARRRLITELAATIDDLSPARLRVAVDGRTAAGKTTFAIELAAALRDRGRSTARASLDDFKHPWMHAVRHGYDRTSGEGYYRNAHDVASATDLLLRPAGADGSGRGPAEDLYLAEVDPRAVADVVIDNSEFDAPRLVGRR